MTSHPSGLPSGNNASLTCGTCTWALGDTEHRVCLKAAAPASEDGPVVQESDLACAEYETGVNCDPCGACCREAFDSVPVGPEDEATALAHPEFIRQYDENWRDLKRVPTATGTRCAALCNDGSQGQPYRCVIYAGRPSPCRDLEVGGTNCLYARRRVGLSV
ncbi:MAG: hypothetical protein GWP91_09990 [Rhodobacterales bacterium]|nr:hypothetical protein [Rhodobacterales bacterium]